jgi:hypothetical protein
LVFEYACASLETLVTMINMEIGVSFLPKIAINSGILDKYPMLIIDKNQAKLSRHIGNQIPTFHADNVIAGDTDWIEKDYIEHLNKHF